jgi:hypothetical protein
VGILRIDHGSRKAASNERLHAFANLFQEQNGHRKAHHRRAVQIVVQAAHMEIGSPTIGDGIPSAVQLCITVPVRMSRPVGSRTRLMMEAIHFLVQDASEPLESD